MFSSTSLYLCGILRQQERCVDNARAQCCEAWSSAVFTLIKSYFYTHPTCRLKLWMLPVVPERSHYCGVFIQCKFCCIIFGNVTCFPKPNILTPPVVSTCQFVLLTKHFFNGLTSTLSFTAEQLIIYFGLHCDFWRDICILGKDHGQDQKSEYS